MTTDVPTLESVDTVCLLLGPTGDITWANASGRRLNPPGDGRPIGRQIEDLVHLTSRALVRVLIEQAIQQGRSEGTVQLAVPRAAPARFYRVVLSRTEDHCQAGDSGADRLDLLVEGWDVTALVRRQQELQLQVVRDALTGASSRWALLARLDHELDRARAHGNRVALLFVEVDRLKVVNDAFGQAAGDCVLAEIASRFQSLLRPEVTLGRIGGDEFVAICPSTADWTAITSIMDRLRAAAAVPIALAAGEVEVTVSIEAVLADEHALGAASLMSRARARRFRAKAACRCGEGRNLERPMADPSR